MIMSEIYSHYQVDDARILKHGKNNGWKNEENISDGVSARRMDMSFREEEIKYLCK